MPPILPANLGLVTIRHLQEEDHFAYVALEKDAEVKMYVSGPTTKTDEEMLGDLRGYRPAMTVLTIAESTSNKFIGRCGLCLLYTSPSPRDRTRSRMPSSA